MVSSVALGGRLRGLAFCFLWYASVLSGFFFLFCPALPLLILHQAAYRKVTDILFAVWEMYPVALMELLFGTRVSLSGDPILSAERSIVLMNHRTRLDWNFLWAAMYHASSPPSHRLKFVLKSAVRHFPGPGWVMQMSCFLYIHRSWERDKDSLGRILDYFRDLRHSCQILIFPEGTDFSPANKKRSDEYAAERHLEKYDQVLHPKTTGFVFLAQRMRQNGQLDAVYDITVAYPRSLPQSEADMARGIFPEEVYFRVKRHPISTLPDSDIELRHWLTELWRDKEEALRQFYAEYNSESSSTKTLLHEFRHFGGHSKACCLARAGCTCAAPPSNALYLALFSWTALSVFTIVALFTSPAARLWVTAHTLLFISLSIFTDGLQNFEVTLFRARRALLRNVWLKRK
ncbi:lysocardiolipin acyltransferase 1-like isoform X2 [Hetaerina americana]|uniref:lysocardiolipin acyltransferase 1-like isoform X2 n=1 Tax=Hetaerina americana TaxID=62018 RepID=UPI003A7F3549